MKISTVSKSILLFTTPFVEVCDRLSPIVHGDTKSIEYLPLSFAGETAFEEVESIFRYRAWVFF